DPLPAGAVESVEADPIERRPARSGKADPRGNAERMARGFHLPRVIDGDQAPRSTPRVGVDHYGRVLEERSRSEPDPQRSRRVRQLELGARALAPRPDEPSARRKGRDGCGP